MNPAAGPPYGGLRGWLWALLLTLLNGAAIGRRIGA